MGCSLLRHAIQKLNNRCFGANFWVKCN
uniref:Uncharacterized protein n=1 Tax=Anguilla anguilla TaxID=7936 RepID=A0A0E9R7A0_ANGAN